MKHICVFFIYNNLEHIIKSFESIQCPNIDYFIIENKSDNSSKIQEYFFTKNLKGYIQFEENISNNAIEIFLKDYKELLLEYDYITITDGDIEIKDINSTFKELIKNLDLEGVGVSCVDLSLDNFPYHIPNSTSWLISNPIITDEYIVSPTGVHLMTLKKENLELLYDIKFVDINLYHRFLSHNLKWVKTKLNKAYHLTWDLYTEDNPYYQFKVQNINHIWNHDKTSNYIKIKPIQFAVVIPTYQRPDGNTPHLLKRTLESVLNQTYQNFKIFLIGDKYEDQEEFLSFKNLIPSDKFYIENLPNAIEREKYEYPSWDLWWSGGVNANNHAIESALKENFKYIAFIDHDDVWHPHHLARFNEVLHLTSPSLVFTQGFYNKSKLPSESQIQDKLEIDLKKYFELSDNIKAYPSIPHECSFIKSSVCIDFSQINLRFRDKKAETGEGGPSDADLWMRIRELVIKEEINPSIYIEDLTVSIYETEGYSRR
jgi:hypothetical protein